MPPASGPAPGALSYRLELWCEQALMLTIGALGEHWLPAGRYAYTGSARRHTAARLWRHLGHRPRRRRWHIDYLLEAPGCQVVDVALQRLPECRLNRLGGGAVPVPGFGASDCRAGCGAHLRYHGRRVAPATYLVPNMRSPASPRPGRI